jgi:hypothetical protein
MPALILSLTVATAERCAGASTNSRSPAMCVCRIVDVRRPLPRPVELTEMAIRVPAGVLPAILLPEQLQRHAGPIQLAMDARQCGCGRCTLFDVAGR